MKNKLRSIKRFVKYQNSKLKIRKLLTKKSDINLEVGAGDKIGRNEWVTLDMASKCDIYWDLRNGIPFPKESISKIYSSHLLEHLTFNEAQLFLDECLRVLKKGGIFSICVPNARLYIDAYSNPEIDISDFFQYKPAYNNTTKIDYINYVAYLNGEHKYMFDEENILHILKQKGFHNVRLREFDPAIDLKKRDFESLYAEGIK